MHNILRLFFYSILLSLAGIGCGGSNDFNEPSGTQVPPGGQNLANQGFRVILSQEDLAELFPPVAPQAAVDPSIEKFFVGVTDESGQLVAEHVILPGNDIDLSFAGLPFGKYDVYVAGTGDNGSVLTYVAANLFPTPNRLLELRRGAFRVVDDFVFPVGHDSAGPPDPSAPDLINVGPDINALHIVGESPCPHLIGNLAIGNNTEQDLNITITISPPLTIDSPKTFTLEGGANAALLDIFFDCSTQESFQATITITATAPDGSVETESVSVSVEIQK